MKSQEQLDHLFELSEGGRDANGNVLENYVKKFGIKILTQKLFDWVHSPYMSAEDFIENRMIDLYEEE
jgi:hypothetical protein